uniref:Uncharacterized protein n=1 Tax=Arundo donax TaxID=35708 RepID=A0A0A9FI08_ARUDO
MPARRRLLEMPAHRHLLQIPSRPPPHLPRISSLLHILGAPLAPHLPGRRACRRGARGLRASLEGACGLQKEGPRA